MNENAAVAAHFVCGSYWVFVQSGHGQVLSTSILIGGEAFGIEQGYDEYYNNGNLKTRTNDFAYSGSAKDFKGTFTYDGLNRLNKMTKTGGISSEEIYSYDAQGNFTYKPINPHLWAEVSPLPTRINRQYGVSIWLLIISPIVDFISK